MTDWEFKRLRLKNVILNTFYEVYVWWLENWEDNFHASSLKIEGTMVSSHLEDETAQNWHRYGPFLTTVGDGSLSLRFDPLGADSATIPGVDTDEDGTPHPAIDFVVWEKNNFSTPIPNLEWEPFVAPQPNSSLDPNVVTEAYWKNR